MHTAQYNWNNKNFTKSAIEICYSESPSVLVAHAHEKLELMYFFDTEKCDYVCQNNKLELKQNDLLVVNPFEVHSCNNWGKNCKVICVLIDLKKLNIPSLYKLYFKIKISNDQEITNIFENIRQILFSSKLNTLEKDCKINSLIYKLLAVLSKYSSTIKNHSNRLNELKDILKFIEQNISQNISIAQLANIMHLSEDRFYHIFKERTGISPTVYILAKRIEKACYYLENTDMKISQIAQECNFCTSSYFTKKFKSIIKITPNQYRKQHIIAFISKY